MYIYLCICIHIHSYIYVPIHKYAYVCIHTYWYLNVYSCMFVMCCCINIYIYTYFLATMQHRWVSRQQRDSIVSAGGHCHVFGICKVCDHQPHSFFIPSAPSRVRIYPHISCASPASPSVSLSPSVTLSPALPLYIYIYIHAGITKGSRRWQYWIMFHVMTGTKRFQHTHYWYFERSWFIVNFLWLMGSCDWLHKSALEMSQGATLCVWLFRHIG